MKSVVVIGSGNVAEALARALESNPRYRLAQVYGRNRKRTEAIASMCGCPCGTAPDRPATADIYLIAVSDRAVAEVSASIDFGGAVVAHTAGSVALTELSERIARRGVFYPLQTFTAGRDLPLDDVPLLIEAEDPETETELRQLAEALSSRVLRATSDQRLRLHLAAVFACNFANRMFAIGQELLGEYGLAPDLLSSLVAETASKAVQSPSAAAVQTGPARRNDTPTMEKHLALLSGHPELQDLYQEISLNIWETSKKI